MNSSSNNIVSKQKETLEECLAYFRQAIADPLSVPAWSEWWATHSELVQSVFSLVDYVRLKHRRLRGAVQILQRLGMLPEEYESPSPLLSGSCAECGERTLNQSAGPGGGVIICPRCGIVCQYDTGSAT